MAGGREPLWKKVKRELFGDDAPEVREYMTGHATRRDCPYLVDLAEEEPTEEVKQHLLMCERCQEERRGLRGSQPNPMSRKHYQFVAETIKAEAQSVMANRRLSHSERMAAIDALGRLVRSFEARFQEDNPKFHAGKFREAAGLESRPKKGKRRRNHSGGRAAHPVRVRRRRGLEIEVCAKCGMPMISEAAWNGLDRNGRESYEFHRGGAECVPCVTSHSEHRRTR